MSAIREYFFFVRLVSLVCGLLVGIGTANWALAGATALAVFTLAPLK